MNYVLVEAWETFTVSDGNIIRDSFAKTHQPPLSAPNMITITQVCVVSIKKNSKGTNQIVEDTLSPINLLRTRNNDHMVII